MAFSQNDDAPVSQMESLLTCSICLETFNDPRTLPCFHSFCRHCLERFVKIQRDNALVDDEIEEFNCPTCRSRFSLKSNENVESMGFSHFIRNMLDVVSVQRQAKNKPAICSKIQCGQPAIAYCTKCELFKCEKCLEFHGSLLTFAKHTVLSMSELPEETATFRCKKHKKEALKYYCQTCNELVCRYCKDLDHVKQNHSCVLAEDYVAYEKRQAFKTSIDDLERKLKKGSEALQAITDVMQRLKYNVDRAKHEVTRHKQEILEKFTLELEQNVKDQINCLDLKYNQSYLSLAKQSSALKSHVDKVESSMDFAKNLLENGNLDDILSSQGLIEQTIEKLEKDYPQTVKPVHNGNIKYQGKPVLVGKMKELLADLFEKAEMSEVSTSSTPQRQAIVDRLRQRIETFRKHHDNCLARLEETQPSRELEEQEETQLLHIQFLENKVKMNPKIRLDQVGKISKQGVNVGQEKAANTVGQAMKRRVDSPQPQIDGEGNLPSNDDLASLVPQKYQRFEGPSDVHVKVKPPNFAGPGDTLPLQTSMSFPHVNGHGGEFPKSEELSKPVVSSYSGSTCENIDRMVTRVPQQYPGNFTSSTFTNRGQPSVSDNLRTSDYPVNFKQENGLLNSDVEGPASIVNGFSSTCTKSEGEFGRLLTTYAENPKSKSKDEDLKTQISQFELVLQGIKNRDGIYNESESKKDVLATAKQPMNTQSSSLVSGLSDSVSHEGAKGSNQLGLSNGNGPNNGTRLPTVAVTSSTHRQHGISPSTAEALQQFVTQKEERLATKVPFERPLFLNPQSVGREQNSTGMPPRPNNFAPIRQIVFDQIQQRRTNQQRAKIHGSQTPQLHARNPAMNPLAATSPYQMHPKVRYPSLSPSTGQPVPSFTPNGRVQQNLMASVHHPSAVPQQQPQPQLQNIPQHQISMYAQQRIAFQRQMATRLPSYSQTQHMSPASMMDIRQKFPGGVHTSHTAQYPVQQQATRNPQPLSHLQHYPNAYSGHSGTQSRPLQPAFMGEHSRYQNPYTNSVNQDNKMHSVYQRHASLDDNLASPRYHNQNGRNTFTYQRSSSMPGHGGVAKNVFNQTSPPVVRLEQTKQNLPDLNNNGNEQRQELTHLHPHPQPQPAVQQPPLTHLKQQQVSQANNLNMNQEQLYQASGLINRSRTQTTANLQQTFSNSFSNLLDLKSNSESSLFPFFGQETSGTSTDNADFDSLLKSPPSDFNLLHILENEPQKALQ